MQDLDSLKAVLRRPCKIAITTHLKPDADALGSSLGMANYLTKKGHEVQVITPSDYPEFLHWMKGNDRVMVYTDDRKEEILHLLSSLRSTFRYSAASMTWVKW